MQILLTFIIILSISSLSLSYPNIDISTSKISKSNQYQYKFQIINNIQIYSISSSQNLLQIYGNLSTLKIYSNLHKTNQIYQCKKLLIKLTNTTLYTKNKSADIQIQMIHQLKQNQNKIQSVPKYVIMTQLFLVTKFINKVQIILEKSINFNQLVQKKIINVKNMLKIIENTQVLMFQYNEQEKVNQQKSNQNKNNQNTFFMIRKQFALISQYDFQKVKQNLISISKNKQVESSQIQQNNIKKNDKNVVKIKQLYEVKQFKEKINNEL